MIDCGQRYGEVMSRKSFINRMRNQLRNLAVVIFICTLSTIISIFLSTNGIEKENLLMIFLLGVLISTAITSGYLYVSLTSVASVFLFNYFFTEPLYTFAISDRQDNLLMAFFLIVALIFGTISSKSRMQSQKAKQNEKIAQVMNEITESFLNLSGTDIIVKNGIKYVQQLVNCGCRVELNSNQFENFEPIESEDFDEKKTIHIYPIKGLSHEIGTITLSGEAIHSEEHILLKTVMYQMALVLDREYMYIERERIKLAMESEHLKSALLRSISHDIRTPLTGIVGAGTIIRDNYDKISDKEVHKLAEDICEEALWLVMTVQNILDMTRITDGKLIVNTEYEAVDDLLMQAASRINHYVGKERLHVKRPDEIILVKVDGKLFVQVLVNLIDNAIKHSGTDTTIWLLARKENNEVIFEITDDGPGIDISMLDTLFGSFVTMPAHKADKGRGAGLGLAICQAIVEAHSGKITAENRKEGGALFRISLPYMEDNING